jgi:hypothetical protein
MIENTLELLDDDESQCRNPCDPTDNCPECADYWERMRQEGFWDEHAHRWTERGWRDILKFAKL